MPDDFKLIGKHMATGAGFAQNFALLHEAGYFDVASETKPLLHLWSLAIEEQFYLLYPPLLWLIWRGRSQLLLVLSMLALTSFIASLIWVRFSPMQAFFLPYPRLWELLAGCILAAWSRSESKSKTPSAFQADFISVIGASLIFVGIFFIKKDALFPGWLALIPVAGAVLLLQAGPTGWVNKRILSHPWVISIGLISYPLYLWHWPLLAYLHITNSATALNCAWAAVSSVLLASLTYRLIEQPIRRRKITPALIWTLSLLMIASAYLGVNTWHRDGLPFRFKTDGYNGTVSNLSSIRHMRWACTDAVFPQGNKLAECWEDDRAPTKIAILGDSKAVALAQGLLEKSSPELPWMLIGGSNKDGSMVPVISNTQHRTTNQQQISDALRLLSSKPTINVVVLATATRALYQLPVENSIKDLGSINKPVEMEMEAGLNRFIDKLIDLNKKIVLVVDNPSLSDPRRCISRQIDWSNFKIATASTPFAPNCNITLSEHQRQSERYRSLLKRVQNRHPQSIAVFDLPMLLCNATHDICGQTKDGIPLYSYSDHISNEASRNLITNPLTAVVRKMSQQQHFEN